MVTVKEKLELIRSGKLAAAENIRRFLEKIGKEDKKINSFIAINENAVAEAQEVDKKLKAGYAGKLAGLAIAVKSNISVKGLPVTCASKTLENYKGTFDADVVTRIKEEGGIIIGMLNMDEFACGASGETSAYGLTDNPAAPGKIPGGSSSGSAAAVAAGFCDIALGSDTGGSIRNPASHCGVVGIKPSYGRVSRYGLVDMAMSLEGIGCLSNDVYGSALMLQVIAGKSDYDTVTKDVKVDNYPQEMSKEKELVIGISDDFEKLCSDKRIYTLVMAAAEQLADASGTMLKTVRLKNVDLAIQAYYPIVYVEFFSATRKFDGRKYGKKIEEACGEEVLRRILGGREISKAEYAGKYYRKALMAKELIRKDFEEAFKEVDILVLPTTPMLPHNLGTQITDPKVMYAYDAFTIPANLAGICGGVVPGGKIDCIPVGVQLFAKAFSEADLLNVMCKFERLKK
jgi:aspartyl-tRNA(Asn)/glutamyl-tRNA(Gln) amidotransferase subunit A